MSHESLGPVGLPAGPVCLPSPRRPGHFYTAATPVASFILGRYRLCVFPYAPHVPKASFLLSLPSSACLSALVPIQEETASFMLASVKPSC